MTEFDKEQNSVAYSLKIPVNFTLENTTCKFIPRLLAYYEDFKAYADESGFIHVSKIKVHSTRRKWMSRLVVAGWAYKVYNGYRMRSRQYVWNWLGIKKVYIHKRGLYKFKYKKVHLELAYHPKVYIKQLVEVFERESIQRKLTQCCHKQKKSTQGLIKGAYRNKRNKSNTPLGQISISGKKIGKVVGNMSESTGLRRRKKYCTILQKPVLFGNKDSGYRYSCAAIDGYLKGPLHNLTGI